MPAPGIDVSLAAGDLTAAEARRILGLAECDAALVAGAPCPPDVVAFFNDLGVPLRDSYGMSEMAPITLDEDAHRIGTVGRPVPGVALRIEADGEILLRGPGLARGYHNRVEVTREAFDADGWFRTGDIGSLDDDGYLRITDRKKELIISDAAKTMSPANIETTLKSAGTLIGQACVIGDRRPYNVALLTPDPAEVAAFAREHGLDHATGADHRFAAAVATQVERANLRLAPHERIRRHRVLPGDWRPGSVELTPTMKVRRRAIAERYSREIEELYRG